MRVIVLGAAGMLGHKLLQRLRTDTRRRGRSGTSGPTTGCRGRCPASSSIRAWMPVTSPRSSGRRRLAGAGGAQLHRYHRAEQGGRDPLPSIAINSLLPHQLAQMAAARGARLIHFSTDCVFSGRRGNYVEDDEPDPVDLYGRSKLLGEVTAPNALTLRTSIVGRELRGHWG